MILHQLLLRGLKHGDDAVFYLMQAQDSIRWLEQVGVRLTPETEVLDLGCGHGVFGGEFKKKRCKVTFADQTNELLPEVKAERFLQMDLDKDDYAALGRYDLVVCSNVFEHLAQPERFIAECSKLLKDGGRLYMSWTNWLSLWGGHEFSPFHYLGPRRGHLLYDKLVGRPRKHTPFVNLFPTYIGSTLNLIRRDPNLRILRVAPRYYTELSFLMSIPGVREFLAWNCALLIGRHEHGGS